MFGLPSFPAIDAMLTILPYCRSRICPITARHQLNVPFRFTAITRSQLSSCCSHNGAAIPAMPALFTRISIFPARPKMNFAAFCTEGPFATSTCTAKWSPAATLGSEAATISPFGRSTVGHCYARPCPGQPGSDCSAYSRSRARNDCCLPRKIKRTHAIPFLLSAVSTIDKQRCTRYVRSVVRTQENSAGRHFFRRSDPAEEVERRQFSFRVFIALSQRLHVVH